MIGFNLQALIRCTCCDVIHLVSFCRKRPHKEGDWRISTSRTFSLFCLSCGFFDIVFSVMPPKKPAVDSAEPEPSPSDDAAAPVEDKAKAKSDAAALRKLAAHPSTIIMVKEALKELDSRKGVSSQAIQSYIKQKYPSVDLVRLKHLVRRALKKGLENGTLVRPANSNVTTGATGKFRLAPKVKEPKTKTENVDPNVPKAPKPAKDGTKKAPKEGASKKKDGASERGKSKQDTKTATKSKVDEEASTSKVAPAKKPKSKKTAEEDAKEDSESTKTKAAKTTKETKAAKTTKETKAGKASKSKAAEAGDDVPASKATGKRGKKTAE